MTAIEVVVLALILLAVFDRTVVAHKLSVMVRDSLAAHQDTETALLAHMQHQEASFRAERERLLRVVVAKNTSEFAALERIETSQMKVAAESDRRRMTEAEWRADIDGTLESMGERPVFAGVPPTPEGI